MSCADFWRSGTAEVFIVIEAAADKASDQAIRDLSLAWTTAMYHRVELLPPLHDELQGLKHRLAGQQDADDALATRRQEIADFRERMGLSND